MSRSSGRGVATTRSAVVERMTRLRPDRVPGPYLAWAIGCWLLTAIVLVLALVPGVTDSIVAERTGSTEFIGVFAAPLGIRLLIATAGAVLTGVLVLVGALRPTTTRVRREVGLAVAAGFPVLALAADRVWLSAAAAAVLFAITEVVAHRGSASTRDRIIVALLAAGPWLVLLVAQFAGPASGGWTWIALFGFAAAFAAFGSYYGVARAAASRSALVRGFFRDDLPPAAVAGILGVAVVVAVLRLTVARDLFPPPDPELWSPFAETPLSWLHAVLVAGVIVAVAAASVRRPLRRSRARGMTAALAVAGNAQLLLAVAVIVAGLVVAALTGATFLPDVPPVIPAALKFAGTLAIALVALLPAFRGTTARALALVTGVYLVPLTLHALLREAGALPPALVGFPATPVQVAVLLLAAAVVLAAVPPLRRAWGTALAVRLALVPLVAVHAGWLLPAAWSGIGRILLVVGVVLALLFLMPKPAREVERHTATVLAASGGQVLALTVFLLAIPSFVDDPAVVVLGLFWLTIAVVAGLVVRTMPGEDDAAPASE
jgi:hypothetical protein